MTFSMKGLD